MRPSDLGRMAGLLATGFLAAAHGQSSGLDLSFDPGGSDIGGLVESVVEQPDGKVLICGNFTSFQAADLAYMARLNTDGTLDPTFAAHPSYWVRHLSLQPDGKIVIGGFFKNVNGQSRNCIARLQSDGSLDPSFNPGTGCTGVLGVSITGNADPFVFQTAIQGDGKILITGNFTNYNGTIINGVARLNPDGSLDTTFQVGSGLNYASWGRSIQVLPNGQILLTGWFDNYHDSTHNRMVLINPDGSPDNSFRPNFGDRTAIYTAVRLPNGQYIAAGHSLNFEGKFKQEIARLNPDGSFDPAFAAAANDKIQSLLLQNDGKIVLGGEFTQVNGSLRRSLARLNADGTLDQGFVADLDNFVWMVSPARGGKMLLSGGFSQVAGVPRSGVARVNLGSMPVGPAPAPEITAPRTRRGYFTMTLQSVRGRTYTLEYSDSFSSNTWMSLPPVMGSGGFIDLIDASGMSLTRFYRVLVQ